MLATARTIRERREKDNGLPNVELFARFVVQRWAIPRQLSTCQILQKAPNVFNTIMLPNQVE